MSGEASRRQCLMISKVAGITFVTLLAIISLNCSVCQEVTDPHRNNLLKEIFPVRNSRKLLMVT